MIIFLEEANIPLKFIFQYQLCLHFYYDASNLMRHLHIGIYENVFNLNNTLY